MSTPKNKLSLMIIESDAKAKSDFLNYFEKKSFVEIVGVYNDVMEAYNDIFDKKPAIIVIDITDKTDLALELINKVSFSLRNTVVFVTSDDSSSKTVISAMRAGAREFVMKPIQPQELDISLEKTKLLINSDSSGAQACKIFTVFSNKGGIGKTAIATNLALSLAEITNKKVALIDLNLQLGDVTTFLDINPSFDISYVVNNLNRVDDQFLLTSLEKYKNKELYILADPPYLEQAEEIAAEQVNSVINKLKSVFSYIIIDTGSNFDSKTLSALDAADEILLVSMVNLPSIRNTQRCLELFNRLGYDNSKIKLVINRYLSNDEIKVEDVEDVLGHKIFWKIPNNYFVMMSAINKGLPVSAINPTSSLNASFVDFAALLSNTVITRRDEKNTKQKSGGLFNFGIFKNLFSKKPARK